MTTTVRVALATRTNVLAVPIRAVRWQGTRAYVLVPRTGDKANSAERRWVTTGLKDESNCEILNGLHEGDEVLVGDANTKPEGGS
jgi:multidrug efflux pump subunit AcrA (membrane-fusion protein)